MLRLIRLISGSLEEVSALCWVEEVAEIAECIAERLKASRRLLAQQRLELRECHLDRIQVGRVWRQEEHPRAASAHQFCGTLALVEADIVENDNVAGLKLGSQLCLDPGLEARGIHRRIDDPRSDYAMAAQAGDEGLRMPFAERSMRPVALAFR